MNLFVINLLVNWAIGGLIAWGLAELIESIWLTMVVIKNPTTLVPKIEKETKEMESEINNQTRRQRIFVLIRYVVWPWGVIDRAFAIGRFVKRIQNPE